MFPLKNRRSEKKQPFNVLDERFEKITSNAIPPKLLGVAEGGDLVWYLLELSDASNLAVPLVFEIALNKEGRKVHFYQCRDLRRYPNIKIEEPQSADAFTSQLVHVMKNKMDEILYKVHLHDSKHLSHATEFELVVISNEIVYCSQNPPDYPLAIDE